MGNPRGSKSGYRRPVVVISSNEFNQSKINTVIVAVITSSFRVAEAPGNFKIYKKSIEFIRDPAVNISQLITLNKSFLTESIGKLTGNQVQLLNEGLRVVLALT